MIRAYKFLMRLTVRQEQALAEMLRDHCSLYNGALQERRDAWRQASKTTVQYGMRGLPASRRKTSATRSWVQVLVP